MTGISDYHRLIYTVLKSIFLKLPAKEIVYRSFEKFCERDFPLELSDNLNSFHGDRMDYDTFESIFTTVLDKHAPLRMKTIQGNEKPHMNKIIKKAVMERSRLWNIYCRNDKNCQDYDAYRKQKSCRQIE